HVVARERAIEAVAPDREPTPESAVNEVAAVAVVEAVVLDDDAVRATIQRHAVCEIARKIAAMREDAPPDADMIGERNEDRGSEWRALRGDEQVVQVDVVCALELEPRVAADRSGRTVSDRHVLRPQENEPPDARAPRADDAQRRGRAGAELEQRVRAGGEDDR